MKTTREQVKYFVEKYIQGIQCQPVRYGENVTGWRVYKKNSYFGLPSFVGFIWRVGVDEIDERNA